MFTQPGETDDFTVSDHIVTGETTTAKEREVTFKDMMKLALETIIEE